MKKNTMLCIDLKTFLQVDALMKEGKVYHGDLMLDGEFHACFIERSTSPRVRRNVRIFDGRFISLTYRLSDGHTRFNFKGSHSRQGMRAQAYAAGVAREICVALRCLGEEK